MADGFLISLWSLLFVATSGILSIGLARITKLHPAYLFILCGGVFSAALPFTFPTTSLIVSLAQLGAFLLVFLSALDIEWDARFSLSIPTVIVSCIHYALLFLPLAAFLYFFILHDLYASLAAAAIAAPFAPHKRNDPQGDSFRSNQIKGRFALTALISEVGSLVLVSLLIALSRKSGGAPDFVQLIVGTLLLVVVLASIIPQALIFLLRKVGEESYVVFYLIIALTVGVIVAVSKAGIDPLIAAYAAGFVISRFVTQGSRVMQRLRFISLSIFVPAFYLYFGLSGILTQGMTFWIFVESGILLLLVSSIRLLVSRFFVRKRELRLFGVDTLHKNPIVLVLLYSAAAQGILTIATTQALFFYCALSEILYVVASRIGRTAVLQDDSLDVQSRVLLPLSNPETMLPLINLATHLGDIDSPPKLYPLNIVPDDTTAEAKIRAIEAQFNSIQRLYRGRGQSVELTARIGNNKAETLANTAREILCDRILLGLGKVPTLQRPQGYSFLENVSHTVTEKTILAAHLTSDLSPTNTIRVIVANERLVQRIKEWLSLVVTLAQRLRSKIVFLGDPKTLEALKLALERNAPKSDYVLRAGKLHAGVDLLTLDSNPSQHTFTLAVLERAHLFPTEKIHARLPEMLLRAYADKNFLLIYPAHAKSTPTALKISRWKKFKRWLGV